MKILDTQGVDVNASLENSGNTSLIIASSRGHITIVERLLKYRNPSVDINFRNTRGWTALHAAADAGMACSAQLLLNSGAQLNIVNKNGWTPLMSAMHRDHKDICEILVNEGANFEA